MKKFAVAAAVTALMVSSTIATAEVKIVPQSESALIKSTQAGCSMSAGQLICPFVGGGVPAGFALAVIGGIAVIVGIAGSSGSHGS